MRKAHKEQAENFIALLGEAHQKLQQLIEKKDVDNATQLLADCQDGAIALGTMIEKSEGEGFVAVGFLEEYCEQIYQVSEALLNDEACDAKEIYQDLENQRNIILESVKQDITVRKEVVFLPYKASMWDSLESVWKKMDADPLYDAYVVPIPYYDRLPGGSFGEFHYEGDLYPKDVPVVSYKDFDLEERHPDEIYIHNPYDEYNIVTSVEPQFYSSKIKNYTDKLVYIPYFVLAEVDPKNKQAVEGMAHFVTVPGVMNAHQVIVQSEDMRQVYIDVMTKATGEHTRATWENKILGTGSPKFDKVVQTDVTDEDIPEEWKKFLYKDDGEKKKVILYNTSVSSLLENSDNYIEKMRRVFAIFQDYKDKVALLWRPHPLIQATISSMRPMLWKEYVKVVEEYKTSEWGIYDDTADLDRAIGMSDAYYGDGSSVVQLCQKAKKPVLIQNVSDA